MARPAVIESLRWMPMSNCLICFAHEAPLIVTGSVPGSACIRLQVLRTFPDLPRLHLTTEAVTKFDQSPAAFCRLCWSKPLGTGGSSCPAGLIAGGLESGEVAIWDPRKALSEMPCLHGDEESFVARIQQRNSMKRDLELGYDFCELVKSQELQASPPLLADTTGNLIASETVAPDMKAPVALLSKHIGSVRGLEFGCHWPNLLGSGAGNGRLMVWDLAHPYAETVPTWQTKSIKGDAVTCIAWSPLLPRVIGSTSFQGLCFWDTRSSKSPTKRVGLFPRRLSGLAFSPVEQNSVVVSCEDYSDQASLAIWDLRKMNVPVTELCESSKGVLAMSWSPHHDDSFLVSTNNDKLMLWSLEKKEPTWKGDIDHGRCYDVQWSPYSRGVLSAASYNSLEFFKLNDRAMSE